MANDSAELPREILGRDGLYAAAGTAANGSWIYLARDARQEKLDRHCDGHSVPSIDYFHLGGGRDRFDRCRFPPRISNDEDRLRFGQSGSRERRAIRWS